MNGELDREQLAHELRNTLAAIDMLIADAEETVAEGGDPLESLAKARAGIIETVEIISRALER